MGSRSQYSNTSRWRLLERNVCLHHDTKKTEPIHLAPACRPTVTRYPPLGHVACTLLGLVPVCLKPGHLLPLKYRLANLPTAKYHFCVPGFWRYLSAMRLGQVVCSFTPPTLNLTPFYRLLTQILVNYRCCSIIIIVGISGESTYDHRSVKTGHPVRSAIHKH